MGLLSTTRVLHNSAASKNFLNRQANDLYVREAKRLGYVCRSAFKLSYIDDQVKLFDKVKTNSVVDLGASPGGWCQIIRQRTDPNCRIVGIDLLPVRVNLPGAQFLQGDVSEPSTHEKLRQTLGTEHQIVDVVTSDMCPNRSGGAEDRHKSAALNEIALLFALKQLRTDGHFICKVLGQREGLWERLYLTASRNFTTVRVIRPPASRMESDESFLVCLNKLAEPTLINDRRGTLNQFDSMVMGRPQRARRVDYGLDNWPGAERRR